MKILIIGNTSMVGKYLYDSLKSRYYVKTMGRSDSDFYIDLSSYEKDILINENFDVIVHTAANFGNNQNNNIFQNEIINSVGSIKVGIVAEKTKCKHLIYISTILSYNVPENGYYGSYGLSKQHGQENLELICKNLNIGFTSLLSTQLYDAHGEARKHQNLFYHIIECAKDNKNICLYGTKNPIRNYLFVEDFIKIIEYVITQEVYGIYPCINLTSYTLSEIATIAIKVFNSNSTISFLPDKPDIPTIWVPNNFELYNLIRYIPETNLEKGISLMKDYYIGKNREL